MCDANANAFMRSVSVNTTDSGFIPPNPRRQALIITSPVTNQITISLNVPAVLNAGISLYSGDPPLMLDRKHYGRAVTGEWRAISAVAAQTITYIEVSD